MNDIISSKENWKTSALINKDQYIKMYNESIENPDNFWKTQAQSIDWITPFSDNCIKKINFSKI